MNEQKTAQPTPHGEPDDLVVGQRLISAQWNVGEPRPNGNQRRAELSVSYIKGREYRAHLRTVDVNDSGPLRTVSFGFSDPVTTVHLHPAGRFSKHTLPKVYASALAILRERFDQDDPDVTRFFDESAESQ